MKGQYFKFINSTTGEVKEFYRRKGLKLSTLGQLREQGFQLIEKIQIGV